MISLVSLGGLTLVARFVAASSPWGDPASRLTARQTSAAQNISWVPCHAPNYECATYQPPLDYANPAVGNARIAMIRFKATRTPKLGTLFVNPGGPGASGIQLVMTSGTEQSNYTGGYFDIVSWDPRGVNNTSPQATCFQTSSEEEQFWAGTIHARGIDSKGDFKDPADLNYFYSVLPSFDAKLKAFGQQCQLFTPAFKYMGTTANVRDIVGMADILDGPGSPINYWGISYGTVIGSYLVNMFPNRVGRVILDSVVDPGLWSTSKPHTYGRVACKDSEAAFDGFCEACAAGRSQCALSSNGTLTAPQVKARLLKLIDDTYAAAKLGFTLGSQQIRDKIFQALYFPRYWDESFDELAQIEMFVKTYQASPALKLGSSPPLSRSDILWKTSSFLPVDMEMGAMLHKRQSTPGYNHGFIGVTCADAIDPGSVTTKDVFDEIVSFTHEVTPTFGASFTISGYYCHAFPARAVERYTGPFNNKLANPILIIGNKADPITPYSTAKKLADGFGDSATLIERDGWGHYSGGMLSNCTINAVANYLIGGKLPASDEFCQTNQALFVEGPEPDTFDMVSTVSPVPVPTGSPVSGPATGATGSPKPSPTSSASSMAPGSAILVGTVAATFVLSILRW